MSTGTFTVSSVAGSYTQGEALVGAIREVLEEAAGTLRTIPVGTFLGDLPEDASPERKAHASVVGPRVEIVIRAGERAEETTVVNSDCELEDIQVDIVVVRPCHIDAETIDAVRDLAQGLSLDDTAKIRQALQYPGNLTLDSSGTPTLLVSGYLRWQRRVARVVTGQSGHVTTVNTFLGKIFTRPATTA